MRDPAEDERKHYPVVEYEYEVDDQAYTSTRIYLDRGTCSPDGAVCGVREYDESLTASRAADDYPAGEPVTVYYDPEDPTTAYLVDASEFPTLRNLFWGGLGVVALVLGVAGLKGVRIELLFGPLWTE